MIKLIPLILLILFSCEEVRGPQIISAKMDSRRKELTITTDGSRFVGILVIQNNQIDLSKQDFTEYEIYDRFLKEATILRGQGEEGLIGLSTEYPFWIAKPMRQTPQSQKNILDSLELPTKKNQNTTIIGNISNTNQNLYAIVCFQVPSSDTSNTSLYCLCKKIK